MNLLVWIVNNNLKNCASWVAIPCLARNALPVILKRNFRYLPRKVPAVKAPNQSVVLTPAVRVIAGVVVLAIDNALLYN